MKVKLSISNRINPLTMDYHGIVLFAISLLNRCKTPLYLCDGEQLTNTLFHVENGSGDFKQAQFEFASPEIAHGCARYLKNALPLHLSELVEIPKSFSKQVAIITNGESFDEYEFVLDHVAAHVPTLASLRDDEKPTIHIPLEVPDLTHIKEVAEIKAEEPIIEIKKPPPVSGPTHAVITQPIEKKINNEIKDTDMSTDTSLIEKKIASIMRERDLKEGSDFRIDYISENEGKYANITLKGTAQKLTNLVLFSFKHNGLNALKLKGTNTVSVEIVKGVEVKLPTAKKGDKKTAKQGESVEKRKPARSKTIAKKAPTKLKAKPGIAKSGKAPKTKGVDSDALIEQIFSSLGAEGINQIAKKLNLQIIDDTPKGVNATELFAVLEENGLAIVPINEAVTDISFSQRNGFRYAVNTIKKKEFEKLLK